MESVLRRLGSTSTPVRYGITIALVLLTFGLRLGFPAGDYGFILFIPVIVAAGFLFDRGSGFLALALSAALIASQLTWHQNPHVHIAALASFILVGGGLVLLSEGLHHALERAYKAEGDKDLLLQEMSHRVKNKFTLIASMIELQGRNSQAPEARTALESIGARVRVITRVHDYFSFPEWTAWSMCGNTSKVSAAPSKRRCKISDQCTFRLSPTSFHCRLRRPCRSD